MRCNIVDSDPHGTRVETASMTITRSACVADAMIEGAFANGREIRQQTGW